MDSRQRIVTASRRLHVTCTVLIWALPVVTALYWLGINWFPPSMSEALRQQLPIYVTAPLPLYALALGYVATMLQVGVLIYGLTHLRRLFGLYAQGLIFDVRNVWCLRGVGKAMIAWAVAVTVVDSLVGIAVTLPNPPGQRILQIGVSSGQAVSLIGGLMVFTIAWVMEEGRKLQAEQSLIV